MATMDQIIDYVIIYGIVFRVFMLMQARVVDCLMTEHEGLSGG